MSELRKVTDIGSAGGNSFTGGEYRAENPTFQSIHTAGADRPVVPRRPATFGGGVPDVPASTPRGKTNRTVAAVSAAVLAISGCAPSPDAPASSTQDTRRVETVVPDQLPPGVAESVKATLALGRSTTARVHQADGTVIGTGPYEITFGSAIMLDNNTAITANHAVGENPYPNCGDLQVVGKAGPDVRKGLVDKVANAADSVGNPDMALLRINPNDLAGTPIPPHKLGPHPKLGDLVFMAGFSGVVANGEQRSPARPEPYSEPAVTAGIVLTDNEQDQNVIIATGFKGYGPFPQAEVEPGMSGGPLLDKDGNVIGETVAKLNAAEDGEAVAIDPKEIMGVDLTNYPGRKVNRAWVRIFTQDEIDKMKQNLEASPLCQRHPTIDLLGDYKK